MQLKVLGEHKKGKFSHYFPSFYPLSFPGRIFNYFPWLWFSTLVCINNFVTVKISQKFNLISFSFTHRFFARRSACDIFSRKSICWCRWIRSVLLRSFCGQERSARHLNQHQMVSRVGRQLAVSDKRWSSGNCKARRRTNHRIIFDDSASVTESLRPILVSCRDGQLTNSSTGNVNWAHQCTSDRSRQKRNLLESIFPGIVRRTRHNFTVFSSVSFASMVDEISHQLPRKRAGDSQPEDKTSQHTASGFKSQEIHLNQAQLSSRWHKNHDRCHLKNFHRSPILINNCKTLWMLISFLAVIDKNRE